NPRSNRDPRAIKKSAFAVAWTREVPARAPLGLQREASSLYELPMRILVSGGAGFIGSHIVEGALAEGHTVAVLDNLSSGKRENGRRNLWRSAGRSARRGRYAASADQPVRHQQARVRTAARGVPSAPRAR